MNINLEAWDNLFGQALLAFLLIEGLKDISVLRTPSPVARLVLNFAANLAVGWAVAGTGSGVFMGSGFLAILAGAIVGAIITAGLHHVWKGVRNLRTAR